MGIFDGVLLCTDLDGTLANGKEINRADADAVKYFKQNGGYFTISTGRVFNYLTDILQIVTPNTYTITLNGAVIIDPKTAKIFKKGFLNRKYLDVVESIASYKKDIHEFYVYYEDCQENVKFTFDNYDTWLDTINNSKKVHKIVFSFTDPDAAIEAMNSINKVYSDIFLCARSWPTGLEILDIESTKGQAVKLLKAELRAKLLVCAGDFENDIPMIKAADIGYAVGNAHPSLKAVADRVTVPQSDGAISHIIKDLEILLRNN